MLGSEMVREAFGVAGGDVDIGADILYRTALSDEFSSASGQYFDNDNHRLDSPHPDALDEATPTRSCALSNEPRGWSNRKAGAECKRPVSRTRRVAEVVLSARRRRTTSCVKPGSPVAGIEEPRWGRDCSEPGRSKRPMGRKHLSLFDASG